ncbi:MAG TPA: hypothetical protein VMW35_11740 [Myxococcota bacterium]|jgi:hypothetical protein|nr:hypothetical protein [Myxococcota bacterium]
MDRRRPAFSSCARCRGALLLDAVQEHGVWYCSQACADGHPPLVAEPPAVPEPWLYHRPRRFFGKRSPKELRGAAS